MLKSTNVFRTLNRFAKASVFLVAGLLAAFTPTAAQADPVVHTLADLLAQGASITSGDKVFTNFAYTRTGNMPDASAINVIPTTMGGNFGLLFQGAFLDLPGGGGSDALISYTVSVAAAFQKQYLITDAHLDANISAPQGGYGNITDTFFTSPEPALTVTDKKLSNSLTFLPLGYTSIDVQKDILLYATTDGSPVTVSAIYQTYSQTPVPEPSTLVLIGTAAFGGLGIIRRRMMK